MGFFIHKTQIMKTKKELQKKLDKLQKEIDNFKEETKLEVGKWYKYIGEHIGAIVNYQGGGDGFGVSFEGNWMVYENTDKTYSSWTFESETENWLPATDKEVEEALIKEAKKRGFKRGVRFNSVAKDPLTLEYIGGCNSLSFKYTSNKDNILVFDGWTCFKNGKWAEIIEDKKPTINGYEMVIDDDYVKFGCAVFHKNRLKELNKVIENWESLKNEGKNNRTIKSIKLCSGTEIKAEELKEVVDYLNK